MHSVLAVLIAIFAIALGTVPSAIIGRFLGNLLFINNPQSDAPYWSLRVMSMLGGVVATFTCLYIAGGDMISPWKFFPAAVYASTITSIVLSLLIAIAEFGWQYIVSPIKFFFRTLLCVVDIVMRMPSRETKCRDTGQHPGW